MANLLSKIKTPNNTEYLLKDSTLVADTGIEIADIDSNNQRKIKNTGVTSIKGNSESAYRTGQVNLTAANIGAKSTQTAVSDVTANGTSLTFISSITQNAQGVITPSKKTVATMGAATASAAGTNGLVPAPQAGDNTNFLRGDGTWAEALTAHQTYTAFTGKPTANQTPAFGGTFTIQQIKQSASGQVSATDRTVTIPNAAATTSAAGLMSAADKTKLDGIATGATANTGTVTSVTPGNGLIKGTSGTSQAAITTTGTISIKEGGVTNAMLAGSIANTKLSNSKVTIAGTEVSLGGSLSADTLRTSLGLSNAMHFVGTTTTTMSDGLTTKNVTINSETYTPSAGDVVLYSDAEFVWTGSAWERLGRDSSFKTTQTAVNDPTASGTSTSFIKTISQDANGVITAAKASLPTASTSTAGIIKIGTTANDAAAGNHNHNSAYVNVSGDTMTGNLTVQNGSVTATSFIGDLTGTATTASKLANTSAVGSTTRPVYFTSNGVPAQTTYRMAGTNATATTALDITSDLNTGIWYVNGTNVTGLYSQADGVAYVEKYNDSWIHEIYGDYRTGHIAVRGKNNGTWQNWLKVLDSDNYGDFAVSKSIGTAAGDLVYWTGASTPARLAKGTDGQVLKMVSGSPAWSTDDDNAVKQSASTTANWRKLLLHYQDDTVPTAAVSNKTNAVYAAVDITAQPSTGTIRANAYNVQGKVTLQYDTTNDCLNFVFA